MRKIIVSIATIGVVAAMAVGVTVAHFADVETSIGNTFAAGEIDLKIDLQCHAPGGCGFALRDLPDEPAFFYKCDIKPGDSDEVTISWHVYSNNAWGKINFANIYNWEYGCSEPEALVDGTCAAPGMGQGELGQNLKFTFWFDQGAIVGWQCPENQPKCTADPKEGDNILNGIETPLVENISVDQLVSQGGIVFPEEIQASKTYYLGARWTIPSDVGNVIQTDSLTGKVVMQVVQSRDNPWPPQF